MTDEHDETSAAAEASAKSQAEQRRDDRANVFDRFFPGPSPRDPRVAARLEAVARAQERRASHLEGRAENRGRRNESGRQVTPSAPPAATTDDIDRIVDALHEQSDVIRSLLDADIAIRDDARATATNSRTFAIAGIVIAFFTLVAAVVTVVDAIVS